MVWFGWLEVISRRVSFSICRNICRSSSSCSCRWNSCCILAIMSIPGVTLPKAGKAGKKARLREKRKKEKEAKGAVALQNVARIRNARQEVAAKRKQKEDQDQDQAAGVLGRVMRGKMGRKKFNEKKEGESITLIQGRFRMLQSKKRVDALKYERKVKEMAAPEDEEDEDFEEAVRQELLSGGEF